MVFEISFDAISSKRNKSAHWDIPHLTINIENPKELRAEIIEHLWQNGALNKRFKFQYEYIDGKDRPIISGVITKTYTKDYRTGKNMYFEVWISIRKICFAEEEIQEAFNCKE